MGKIYSKKPGESKREASKRVTNVSKRLKYITVTLIISMLINIYFAYFLTTHK